MKIVAEYIIESKRPEFANHAKFAQEIMSSFELSGLFSEALLRAVYCNLMGAIAALERSGPQAANKYREEFIKMLDTYCIFSDSFKRDVRVKYMSLIS